MTILVGTDPRLRGARAARREAVVRAALGRALSLVGGGRVEPVVSVLLCGEARIRAVNREWLGRDRPTNVISWRSPAAAARRGGPVPLARGALARAFRGARGELFLGDLAIGVTWAARQARAAGLGEEEWLAALAFHGLMHLLGYTHRNMPRRPSTS